MRMFAKLYICMCALYMQSSAWIEEYMQEYVYERERERERECMCVFLSLCASKYADLIACKISLTFAQYPNSNTLVKFVDKPSNFFFFLYHFMLN